MIEESKIQPWNRDDNSTEPFGKEFSLSVVNKLKVKKEACVNIHRDFCGICLVYDEKSDDFSVSYVNDGYIEKESIVKINGTDQFVDWLSKQSDFTFSGHDERSELYEESNWTKDNQRITRKKLIDFLKE
eukprot:gene9294-1382_t